MARISVDQRALTDPRFALLSKRAGLADSDHARAKCERVWNECQERGLYHLAADIIDAVSGIDGFSKAMIAAELAVVTANGVRIKGTEGRIEWLEKKRSAARENGKKGGRPITNIGLSLVTPGFPPETPPAPAPAPAPAKKQKKEATALSPAATSLAVVWNENCGNLPKVKLPLVGARAKVAADRMKERPDLADWAEAARKCANSPFCRGENDRKWIASFTFFVRPESFDKIMEGVYDSRDKPVRKPDGDFKLPPRLASLLARHGNTKPGGEGGGSEAGPVRVPPSSPSANPPAGVGSDAAAGREPQGNPAIGPASQVSAKDEDREWIP